MSDTRNPMLTTIVTVHVSQDHINRGKITNCWQCPIALAILDRLGMPNSIECPLMGVLPSHVSFYDCVKFTTLPSEARQFIQDFDKGK